MKGVPVIRIRGYHADMYGHVNNARYLEFLEEGRWRLFEDYMDLKGWFERGLSFFVVNINISYKRSIEVNEVIEVRSGILKYGAKSAVLRQQIFLTDTDTLCAEADVTFVAVSRERGHKALPMEGEISERLRLLPVIHENR
ncbi:acyl-CoA thioesterase [Desulfobotulus sp. H1]|uniref:Acyl-CoA thioesterase n=1 Tax=Desulfobotulus pelophilus TaxID=2823377 RepID=A0ABT3N5V0_9BACT|nr:thioesterase family protein [Desulfobotulus pelophilus]MCW7752840.1 acyl-CoA thioesterase [Desulfobotulus pelophilus]